MKKLVLLVTTLICYVGYAQIPVEVLVGNKQTHYLNYWQKGVDSSSKFNVFSLSRFALDHKEKSFNNFTIEGQLTYQLKDWFGISVGGSYAGNNFVPTIGISLSYANRKGDFLVQSYPTLNLDDIKSFNFFGIVGYSPKLTKNWGIFTQLIFSTNLQVDKTDAMPKREILNLFTAHIQSTQLLRVGLNYQDKFQFGLGVDLNQFYKNNGNFSNLGIFIRTNL